MKQNGSDQWDEVYPDMPAIEQNIKDGSLYIVQSDGIVIAMVSLNKDQDLQYQDINWKYLDGNELVVHRLCVHPQWQNKGIAGKLVDYCETIALESKHRVIRLDAYTANPASIKLYENRNYQYAGQVFFPRRRHPFNCYEKDLLG